MRRIRIEQLCDWCVQRDDTETDAKGSISFAVGGRPKLYEHCTEHDNPTWLDLLDLATDDKGSNAPVRRASPRAAAARTAAPAVAADVAVTEHVRSNEPVQCPRCDKTPRSRKLGVEHLVRVHGLSQREASHLLPPPTGGRYDERIECAALMPDGEVCGYLTVLGPGYGQHVISAHGREQWERIQADRDRREAS